jgi:chromosome segregation ATPase
VAAAEAELAELEARVNALADEQEALQAAVRDAKAEGHDLADKAAAAKQAVAAARAEGDALRAKIVDAPEVRRSSSACVSCVLLLRTPASAETRLLCLRAQRAEGALAEMRGAVERERARAGAGEARVRDLTTRAEQLGALEKDIRKAVGLMGEAAAEVAARKEAARVLKAARAQIALNEAETWRFESDREHLQRTLGTLAERQARLEQQGELKVRPGPRVRETRVCSVFVLLSAAD